MNNPFALRLNYPRLIAVYIIVLPSLIDLLHGFLDTKFGFGLVSSAYRASIILMALLIFFFQLKISNCISLISLFIIYLSALFFWYVTGNVHLFTEISTFVNISLVFVVIYIFFWLLKNTSLTTDFIYACIVKYGLYTSIILVVSLIFGIGEATYSNSAGDVYGFGTQSFYIAGNVLGLSLVLSQLTAGYLYFKTSENKYFFYFILIFAGAFSIGSRTGMAVSSLLLGVFLVSVLFNGKSSMVLRVSVLALALPASVLVGYKAYEVVTKYPRMVEKVEMLITANIRAEHGDAVKSYLDERALSHNLYGEGYSSYIKNLAAYSPKQRETATAEQDLYDAIGVYGLVISILLFMPYLISLIASGASFLFGKNQKLTSAFLFASVLMILGHSIIAGHVVFSSKMAQFAAIFIALSFSLSFSLNKTKVTDVHS